MVWLMHPNYFELKLVGLNNGEHIQEKYSTSPTLGRQLTHSTQFHVCSTSLFVSVQVSVSENAQFKVN